MRWNRSLWPPRMALRAWGWLPRAWCASTGPATDVMEGVRDTTVTLFHELGSAKEHVGLAGTAAYVRGHVQGCYRAAAGLPGDVPGAAAGKRSGSVRMICSGCATDAYRASRCRCRWSLGEASAAGIAASVVRRPRPVHTRCRYQGAFRVDGTRGSGPARTRPPDRRSSREHTAARPTLAGARGSLSVYTGRSGARRARPRPGGQLL